MQFPIIYPSRHTSGWHADVTGLTRYIVKELMIDSTACEVDPRHFSLMHCVTIQRALFMSKVGNNLRRAYRTTSRCRLRYCI